jgi:hypothetical protein
MTPWLLMRVALHLAGKEFLTVPDLFWVTFAAAGEEIPGITRVSSLCADPEALSSSAVQWANAADVAFTNTPDAEVDEVWVLDAQVGGNVWYAIPKAVTLVDGGNKTFRAGALAHIIETP